MTIKQTLTTSFKQQILLGEHNLATDTIKLALYTAFANLGDDTQVYDTANEVVGTGYTAGGKTMTGVTVSTNGKTAFVDFDDAQWVGANFTARGGLLYNASKGNKSIAVVNFGSDKTCTTTFSVQMPANTAQSALLRIK
jgi:hypothetical protein